MGHGVRAVRSGASMLAVGTLVALAVAACTLTTDLDGLAGASLASDGAAPEGGSIDGAPASAGDAGDAATGPARAAAYRELVLGDGALGYWRLDDQGSVAKDELGTNDGMYVSTSTHVPGIFAGTSVASFDSGRYVVVGKVFDFVGQVPYSLEAWVAPIKDASTAGHCVIAKDVPNSAGDILDGWALHINASLNLLSSRWRSSSQDSASGPTVLADGAFSHIAMTFDGTFIRVFINGVMTGQTASAMSLPPTDARLTIGVSRDGEGCNFRGALGEVALYGTALAADRIRAHYLAGTTTR